LGPKPQPLDAEHSKKEEGLPVKRAPLSCHGPGGGERGQSKGYFDLQLRFVQLTRENKTGGGETTLPSCFSKKEKKKTKKKHVRGPRWEETEG